MELSKLKNMVLIILLCVNAAFAAILLTERADTAGEQTRTREGLVTVLAGRGIRISAETIPDDTEPVRYQLERDEAAEKQFAEFLLGETAREDLGGRIYSYENENGYARFRSAAGFEVLLRSAGGSPESRFREAGVRLEREAEDYICLLNDRQVFNCRFGVSLAEGGVLISGRLLLGNPVPAEAEGTPGAATLLLRFCDLVQEAGGVYTEISAIRVGYVLTGTVGGTELVPAWEVKTDGGTWYLDISGRKLLNAA